MKGLFRKDLLLVRSSWYVQLFIAGLVTGILLYYEAAIGLFAFLTIFGAMQMTSTIFIDRACGWTAYSVIFPISRQQIIRSKYLFALVGGAAGALAASMIILLTGARPDAQDWQINLCITAILTCSIIALQIPLAYILKKSAEFLAIAASMLLPGALILIWSQSITSNVVMVDGVPAGGSVNLNLDLLFWMAVFCVVLLVVSFFVTPPFLAKRDV